MDQRTISYPLAAFSLALGALDVFAGRKVARKLGVPRSVPLVRSYGAREIATGAMLLARPKSSVGAWARAAGDVLDLATIGAARRQGRGRRKPMMQAALFVGAALLADVAAGLVLQKAAKRAFA
jgi:hypothetical protein